MHGPLNVKLNYNKIKNVYTYNGATEKSAMYGVDDGFFLSVHCYIPFCSPHACVNKTKDLTANKQYHYQHSCKQNGYTSEGKYHKIEWEGKITTW